MKNKFILILLFGLFVGFGSASNIGDVSLSFCNFGIEGSSLEFVAQAGVPYEVCLKFDSSFAKKTAVAFDFVDGVLTSDEMAKKACSHNGEKISGYVFFDKKVVYLSSGNSQIFRGNLVFPLGYSGIVNSCVVYSIVDEVNKLEKDNSVFDVVVRKASFVDGRVIGTFVRDFDLDFLRMSAYVDYFKNDLIVKIPIYNKGVINEILQYSGVLSNSLGYERLQASSLIVNYGTSTFLVFRFGDIPFYKGSYLFSISANSVLDTKLDLSYLSDEEKKTLSFVYTKSLFFVPWNIIVIVIGFFVILFVLRLVMKVVLRR